MIESSGDGEYRAMAPSARRKVMHPPRRMAVLAAFAAACLLAGCAGAGLDGFFGPSTETPQPNQGANVIGNGAVKIALILPLSSTAAQTAAQSLRNAAEMAINDFGGGQSAIQIIVKDDRGTPDGARQAVQEAIGEGAELILGPLFGSSVQAAAIARPAGKPMIAFSSDAATGQRGVYLLSFLPQSDVNRIVNFAGSRGKRSIAALIPQNAYGNVVEAELMQVGNQAGRRVGTIARYQPGNRASIDAAVAQIKNTISQADTLFIGESADGMGALVQSLAAAGITGRQIQFISTGNWNDSRLFGVGMLNGAWFAAPDNARFNALAQRYQSRFGSPPTRVATLSYDAVTLASLLTQNFGTQRFSEATLTNPNGFSGQDGVFRFRQTGPNERGLAVYEIRSGSAQIVSPAPASFTATN